MISIERIQLTQCCVSFDFDDTLAEYASAGWYGGEMLVCIPQFLQLLKEYFALGCKCVIMTARTPQDHHVREINSFLKWHNVDHMISEVIFTSHEMKGPYAVEHGIHLHYDDSDKHLESCRAHGIKVVKAI